MGVSFYLFLILLLLKFYIINLVFVKGNVVDGGKNKAKLRLKKHQRVLIDLALHLVIHVAVTRLIELRLRKFKVFAKFSAEALRDQICLD